MRHPQTTDKTTVFVSYRRGVLPCELNFFVGEAHHGPREEFVPCLVELGPRWTHELGHLVAVRDVFVDVFHRRGCYLESKRMRLVVDSSFEVFLGMHPQYGGFTPGGVMALIPGPMQEQDNGPSTMTE